MNPDDQVLVARAMMRLHEARQCGAVLGALAMLDLLMPTPGSSLSRAIWAQANEAEDCAA